MVHYNKQDKILVNIAGVIEKRLKDKNTELTIVLDESMGEFNSKFEDGVITAGSHADILYVAGKYLRHPDMENGEFHSFKPICGLYWATHNHGYAECAPMEELYEDLEEQGLWGMNCFQIWFSMAEHKIEDSADFIDRLKKLMKFVKSLGIKTSMIGLANEAFGDSPMELRADWTPDHDGYVRRLNAHYHKEICPSKPGGIEKILEYRRQVLEAFKDAEVDFLSLVPYDQGGCTCTDCAPWGGNGYTRCIKAVIPLLKEYNPNAKLILSTWYFGKFREKGDVSEFDLLREDFSKGNLDDVAYITCEPQMHAYPFEKPLGRPYIGFPEISMCGIWPWGGYGAIAIPMKMQKLWDNNKDKLSGGFPYCEGYYEDLNKVVMLRLYRDDQPADVTVREYLTYEFGFEGEMLDKVHAAVMAMEETHARGWDPGHRYPINHPEKIFDIEKTILEAHESLCPQIRDGKKWRLFYYRAVIDAELARNDFYRNDKVIEYFKEMITLYHLENAGWHIKPDLMTDEKYGRPLTKEELKTIALGGSID